MLVVFFSTVLDTLFLKGALGEGNQFNCLTASLLLKHSLFQKLSEVPLQITGLNLDMSKLLH